MTRPLMVAALLSGCHGGHEPVASSPPAVVSVSAADCVPVPAHPSAADETLCTGTGDVRIEEGMTGRALVDAVAAVFASGRRVAAIAVTGVECPERTHPIVPVVNPACMGDPMDARIGRGEEIVLLRVTNDGFVRATMPSSAILAGRDSIRTGLAAGHPIATPCEVESSRRAPNAMVVVVPTSTASVARVVDALAALRVCGASESTVVSDAEL